MKKKMQEDVEYHRQLLKQKVQEKEDIKVLKDSEKVKATDKLKKHMLEKI